MRKKKQAICHRRNIFLVLKFYKTIRWWWKKRKPLAITRCFFFDISKKHAKKTPSRIKISNNNPFPQINVVKKKNEKNAETSGERTAANLKTDLNFSIFLTVNLIILYVYYSYTLIRFKYKIKFNNLHRLTIKTKRILGLQLIQIQVQIILTFSA